MFTLRLGYLYNIDVPTILHKYDIDDPESAINNAKRMFENSQEKKEDDDVDYGMKLTKGEGSLIIPETIKEKSTFQVKVLRRNVDFSLSFHIVREPIPFVYLRMNNLHWQR